MTTSRRHLPLLLGTVLLLAGLAMLSPRLAAAQDATMTVVVQSDGLSAETFGSIAVLADGVECARTDVAAGTTEVTLTLGAEDQPEVCRTPGARLTFEVGSGNTLVTETTFSAGTTFTLDNLAPPPPASGGAAPGSGAAPTPAVTGSGSLHPSTSPTALIAGLAAVALLLTAAARRLTRRPR